MSRFRQTVKAKVSICGFFFTCFSAGVGIPTHQCSIGELYESENIGLMGGGNLPAWFKKSMDMAIEKAGSVKALSEKIGIPRTTMINWSDGSSPGVHHVDRILTFLGCDMSRAMPDWQPSSINTPEMLVYGQVNAGMMELGGDFQYPVPAASELFKSSRYWEITEGKTILLEVFGDSMFPQYRNGQLIVCRKPLPVASINDGTPVIFRESNGYTFKLYRRSTNGHVVGEPINRDYAPVVLKANARAEFIVIGTLDSGAEIGKRVSNEKSKAQDFIKQARLKKGMAHEE